MLKHEKTWCKINSKLNNAPYSGTSAQLPTSYSILDANKKEKCELVLFYEHILVSGMKLMNIVIEHKEKQQVTTKLGNI